MNELERRKSELQRGVDAGLEHFASREDSDTAAGYVRAVVLPLFRDAVRAVADRALENHRVDNPPNKFIHYTSSYAVVSILQGKLLNHAGASVRLYDTEHANDPKEGTYLAEALDLPDHLRWAATPAPSHAYVCSFVAPSNERDFRDLLLFWEAYGDRGRGCALEIVIPSENLHRVRYGVSGAHTLRSDIIDILEASSQIIALAERTIEARDALWEALASIRYLYKDAPYDHEMECRIVIPKEQAHEDKIQFDYQSSNGHLRRYYELPFLDPMEIFVGDYMLYLP